MLMIALIDVAIHFKNTQLGKRYFSKNHKASMRGILSIGGSIGITFEHKSSVKTLGVNFWKRIFAG